jgi:hypothetical protein
LLNLQSGREGSTTEHSARCDKRFPCPQSPGSVANYRAAVGRVSLCGCSHGCCKSRAAVTCKRTPPVNHRSGYRAPKLETQLGGNLLDTSGSLQTSPTNACFESFVSAGEMRKTHRQEGTPREAKERKADGTASGSQAPRTRRRSGCRG